MNIYNIVLFLLLFTSLLLSEEKKIKIKNGSIILIKKTLWNIEKYKIILKDNIQNLSKKFNNNIDIVNKDEIEYLKDEIEYIKNNKTVLLIKNNNFNNLKNVINHNVKYDLIVHTIYKTNGKQYIKILNNLNDINNNYKLSDKNFIYIDVCLNNDEKNKVVIDNKYIFNIIGNKIFDRSFMKWFLSKNYNINLNNENYVINTIDNNINSDKLYNNDNLKEFFYIKKDIFSKIVIEVNKNESENVNEKEVLNSNVENSNVKNTDILNNEDNNEDIKNEDNNEDIKNEDNNEDINNEDNELNKVNNKVCLDVIDSIKNDNYIIVD